MIHKKVFDEKKFSFDRSGEQFSFASGKLAVQTDASVVTQFGGTALMATVCMEKNPNPEKDFLPLTVDFRESYSAAGKIGGALYRRREGRPADAIILYARLTDRALRPMFPKGMINDIVLSYTPMALDHSRPLGAQSIIAGSMGIMLAGIPFDGPVGAVQIAYKNGEFIINPTHEQLDGAILDLVVAGKTGSINMIESESNEVPKDILKKAFELGQQEIDRVCAEQKKFLSNMTIATKEIHFNKPSYSTLEYISSIITPEKLEAMTGYGKISFNELYYKYEKEVLEQAKAKKDSEEAAEYTDSKIKIGVFQVIKDFLRDRTVQTGKRVDDRSEFDIRDLYCEVGVFDRLHGSGLFWRGETQVLTTTTLGGPTDYLVVEDMENDNVKERYFHHYNFPPFSVGEAKPIRFVGRREIGHGKLAEKALRPMLPSVVDFPYSIRTVSECLGSGGSTSMGSTCASTLSLMHAGVPIKKPVSGIAMGMMSEHEEDGTITKYRILNDIMGTEDFTGDMDFKVAGTRDGINAIQLDTKLKGIPLHIVYEVIERAFDGYNEILTFMLQTIDKPNAQLSAYAPKIFVMKVDPAKIKDVIGKGGEMIDKIIEQANNVKIDFEDDGTCFITHQDQSAVDKAVQLIKDIVEDLEIGAEYEGVISRVEAYGVFVDLPKKKSGMCHVSKLGPKFTEDVSKSFRVGDKMKVKVLGIDEKGRINIARVLG